MKSTLKKELRKNGYIVQPVVGDSMMPMLDEKSDAVRLVKYTKKLKEGDIPLCLSGGKYVLHRIIQVKKFYCITKGDNRSATEKVSKRKIVAVADGYYKSGRFISFDDPEYVAYCRKVLSPDYFYISPELVYTAKLYTAAVKESFPPYPDTNVDWKKITAICKRQRISASVFFAAAKISDSIPGEVFSQFRADYDKNLRKEILFEQERKAIFEAFENAGVLYMPLKGIVINTLYPHRGMRQFADNDILYPEEKRAQVSKIFQSRGYTSKLSSGVHDVYLKSPIYNFEMHRTLFASDSPYVSFFADIWQRARRKSGSCEYIMKDEDFYIYFLAHFAKHFCGGGCGIRFCGDLYILRKYLFEKPGFDKSYVENAIKKLSLCGFEKEICEFTRNIFELGNFSDTKTLSSFMTASAYGDVERQVIKEIKSEGKAQFILKKVFLPYTQMRKIFPVLSALPPLLPFFWAFRLISCFTDKNKRKSAFFKLKIWKNTEIKKSNNR